MERWGSVERKTSSFLGRLGSIEVVLSDTSTQFRTAALKRTSSAVVRLSPQMLC